MSCKNLLKTAAAILLLCVSQLVMAQDRVVTGKVTDSKDGTPVVGASVQPKGTRTGTATKNDGTFTITVGPNVTTLVFSSVGFATQELGYSNNQIETITMHEAAAENSEVVVVPRLA